MRNFVVHGALVAVVVAVGVSNPSARQSHAHPEPAKAPATKATPEAQKPGSEKKKPNRPKPENQPGAVKNAEALAASHAGHHEMAELEGGGVLPEGWSHRFDLPNMKLEHMRFLTDGESLHITSGPPGIYYNPSLVANGEYVVKATFTQLAKGEHREGYGPLVGGTDLDGDDQRYLYFLLRQDGRFLIKERIGTNTRGISDWTPHSAVKSFAADGRMTNELAIAVDAGSVRFLINGTEVARKPRSEVKTDGIVGLRVNHQLDIMVDHLTIEPAQQ